MSKKSDFHLTCVRSHILGPKSRAKTVPIRLVSLADDLSEIDGLTDAQANWLQATGFRAKEGNIALVPQEGGGLACVLLGTGVKKGRDAAWLVGELAPKLPEGNYHLDGVGEGEDVAGLAWIMGAYRFAEYKTGAQAGPTRLKFRNGKVPDPILRIADGVYLGRDLINRPANDLGPGELEQAARSLAARHDCAVNVICGDGLLTQRMTLIHAVGRASSREPRLIDIGWGPRDAAKVTLVGKGICFDTGGLNLKPGGSMGLMKKDMGGAAAVLSLASMIMDAGLPLRLRVLIPAAENSVAGSAFRPGDVYVGRGGKSVEIENTDAEGRLVLADALALASEEGPDEIISFATLTGAARVALGAELAPFYTSEEAIAESLQEASAQVLDPIWRMPFWQPYEKMLASQIADMSHISHGPFAGSITAALFLKKFVEDTGAFTHFDIYGWVPQRRPAQPKGGEVQGVRAVFESLSRRYSR